MAGYLVLQDKFCMANLELLDDYLPDLFEKCRTGYPATPRKTLKIGLMNLVCLILKSDLGMYVSLIP